jgi:hypothetical protein
VHIIDNPFPDQYSNEIFNYYYPGEIGPNGVRGTQKPTGQSNGNHEFQGHEQDYQKILMLLEQQNKKRLMMAGEEQENMVFGGSANHQAGGRNSLMMKRGSPYMNDAGMLSPFPEGESRGLYSGGMIFNLPGGPMDPNANSPYYLNNMNLTNIDVFGLHPPTSHPGAASNQITPPQMARIQQQQAATAQMATTRQQAVYPVPVNSSFANNSHVRGQSPVPHPSEAVSHVRPSAAVQSGVLHNATAIQRSPSVSDLIPAEYFSGTFSPIQSEPLGPQKVDSVVHLFSALGIDPIALGIPSESLSNVHALREYLSQTQGRATLSVETACVEEPNRYLILHRISRWRMEPQIYFDPPEWVVGQNHTRILKSRLPLSNLPDYLKKHTDISFIVFRDYADNDMPTSKEVTAAAADKDTGITKSPVYEEEKILPVSEHLTEAINVILKSTPEFADLLTWFEKAGAELPSPFVFIYHSRAVIQELIDDTCDTCARQLKLMIDYIYNNYRAEYDAADALFVESRVAKPYIKYLFKPGDVLVKGTGTDVNGYMLKTWPRNNILIEASPKEAGKNKNHSEWNMDVCSWSFDGAFKRVSTCLTLEIDGTEKTEHAIRDLNIRPIAYASDEDRKTLQSRGEMFWKCRERHFVSYQERGRGNLHGASEERFMIDMKTFRELHPGDEKKKKTVDEHLPSSETLDEDAMAQDNPPHPNFVYLLPQKIIGYNMRRKKWVELHADWLSEVVWDKEAFKKLVLAQKTKDLIEALIVNQIAAEKSTDLISGKGNGLILLLHGGPGTGKTLTAESVAEIAEKPLYRVTCGDIGSEPEEVEQYLNSVLDLGKAWSCVVLLDEADVFLEERSMSDIKRNALVSIFLRVLEYHDGIIILTSNRVGTFDEAFKSRIQLALHYPSLTKAKRYEIWTMFITRLRELGETQVDFGNLEDNRWELASYKLNGRQIRNAIQTSRQYVSWKNVKEKTILNFEVLKEIIEISGEFDVYIDKLNNGMTPDQLAEEDGLRLAEAKE